MIDETEYQRLRERLHKMADEQQRFALVIGQHELRLGQVEQAVKDLRDTMATSEQLEAAVELVTLKLTNLSDAIAPIRKGVYAVVWLLVSSIIVALLALLLTGPKMPLP